MLLPSYLSLFAILFQAIFASSSLDGSVSLSISKFAPFKSKISHSKAKPAVNKLVCKKKLPSTRKKTQNKHGKNNTVVVKANELKLLIELLLKELVEIVVGYFNDDTYPFIVSTHNWLLKGKPRVAVDGARLYVIADAEGIKCLNHTLANIKEDKCHLIEFANPQWFGYDWSGSSRDGRYVSFKHKYKVFTAQGEQTKRSVKWLTQRNEPEDGRPKSVILDGEDLSYGLLSRDGQTLCSFNFEGNLITRVYRLREEVERGHIGLIKFELYGATRAVSGKGNRVMTITTWQLEIHDIDKDASKLVCQIDVTDYNIYACALNEDGSEAAFISGDTGIELRIVDVGKVAGVKADQPAIVTIKVPESTGQIYRMVYSDEGKLHVLHTESKVSLFDPLTKEFILLEAPQKGQTVTDWEISPNADYTAAIQKCDDGENGVNYRTIVKRKLESTDLKDLFGYENPSRCTEASTVLTEEANLTQARDVLSQSMSAPPTNLTTIPVKEEGCVLLMET